MMAVANGINIDIFNRQTGHIELTLKGHTEVSIFLNSKVIYNICLYIVCQLCRSIT